MCPFRFAFITSRTELTTTLPVKMQLKMTNGVMYFDGRPVLQVEIVYGALSTKAMVTMVYLQSSMESICMQVKRRGIRIEGICFSYF